MSKDLAPIMSKIESELKPLLINSPMFPRPYQIEALAELDRHWETTTGEHPLIWASTGLGKTLIFSSLILLYFSRWKGLRILVLAATKELIEQAEEKVFTLYPKAPVGVYCAGMNRKEINQITIASRGSIAKNINHLGHVDLIIVDECDEIPESESSQYQKILAGLAKYNPFIKVIGFTATPFWSKDVIYKNGSPKDDKKIFDKVVFKRDVKWGIDNGYLTPATTKAVHAGEIDTSKIKMSGSDFNQKELEAASIKHELVEGAIKEWYEQAFQKGRMSTLFFCVSVKHAEMVSIELRGYGIDAPVIHGGTSKVERENIIKAMRSGELYAAVNVNCLTRGTDIPRICCVALLRSTASLRLYIQMVGRGLRLSPDTGKKDCLIMDFGGNAKRFGVIDQAMPPRPKGEEPRMVACKHCEEIVSIFKSVCPACGGELKPRPKKMCGECGEENSLGAKSCAKCEKPFIKHAVRASGGDIVSSGSMLREFPVDKVTCQVATSRNGNKPYLKVCFWSEGFNVYFKNLMFSWANQHAKACAEWNELVIPSCPIPSDPFHAENLFKTDSTIFKLPKSIMVDMATSYKEIININYDNNHKQNR